MKLDQENFVKITSIITYHTKTERRLLESRIFHYDIDKDIELQLFQNLALSKM